MSDSQWKKSRRATLKVLYDEVDISTDVAEYLSSFTYTDNTDDKADDLQIELEDRDHNWSGSWSPIIREETTETVKVATPGTSAIAGFEDITGSTSGGLTETTITTATSGSILTASIIIENWESDGTKEELPCGTFEIDELTLKGPPDTVTIKAITVPTTSKLRNQTNTRAWEEVTLSRVASDLATANGMSLSFNSEVDPEYDRLDQLETADLAYLQSLCSESGLSLKATGTDIVIFDQITFESQPSSFTIKKGTSNIISYSFTKKSNDTYSKATVTYHDPKSGQTATETFEVPNSGNSGSSDERPALLINTRPSKLPVIERKERKRLTPMFSESSARSAKLLSVSASSGADNFDDILSTKAKDTTTKQAKSALRAKNKNENKVQFTLVGDIRMCGGLTFDVVGWQKYDGKYIIEVVKHTVTSSGYQVNITAHKCLEGY